MADQKITFQIGSVFKGEGFQKAQNTVKTLNDNIKKGTGIAQQAAGALGGLDNACGKAANAVSGLVSALALGNPILAGVVVAITAVNAVMDYFNKKEAEAKKLTDEYNEACKKLKETQDKIWSDKLQADMKTVYDTAQKIKSEFEFITKSAKEIAQAMAGLSKSENNARLIDLQTQKFQATKGSNFANTEAGKEQQAIIAAEYDYKIALEKSKIALEEKTSAVESATKKETETQQLFDNKNSEISSLDDLLISLRTEQANTRKRDLKRQAELKKKIEEVESKKLKAEEELHKLSVDIEAATIERIKAENERENQKAENHLAEMTAQEKVVEAKNAQAEGIKRREEEAEEQAKKEEEARQKEIEAREKAADDIQSKIDKLEKGLIDPNSKEGLEARRDKVRQAAENAKGLINTYGSNGNDAYNPYADNNGGMIDAGLLDAIASDRQGRTSGAVEKWKQSQLAKSPADSRARGIIDKGLDRAIRDATSSNPNLQRRRDEEAYNRLSSQRHLNDADKKRLEGLKKMGYGTPGGPSDGGAAQELDRGSQAIVDEIKTLKDKLDELTAK